MKVFKFFYFWLIFLIILTKNLFPQVEYFTKGTELINIGKYKEADSLLTIALCNYRHENVYINRALARIYMNDTLGFCEDIGIAANKYLDSEASKLFCAYCCKYVDTIYYDRKYNVTSNLNYRYYEVIKFYKYDSIRIGTFHDINYYDYTHGSLEIGCEDKFLGVNLKKNGYNS